MKLGLKEFLLTERNRPSLFSIVDSVLNVKVLVGPIVGVGALSVKSSRTFVEPSFEALIILCYVRRGGNVYCYVLSVDWSCQCTHRRLNSDTVAVIIFVLIYCHQPPHTRY